MEKTKATAKIDVDFSWLFLAVVVFSLYATHWVHDFAFVQCLHAPGMSKAACAEFAGLDSADIDGLTTSQVVIRSVQRSMEEVGVHERL